MDPTRDSRNSASGLEGESRERADASQAELDVPRSHPKVLLVGEVNPYGPDSRFALFPRPRESAGGRLCHDVLGMREVDYLRSFDRVNLCVGSWSLVKARARAEELLAEPRAVIVLLGQKVATAFRVDFQPFTHSRLYALEPAPGRWYLETEPSLLKSRPVTVVVLPHPSGLCRLWNEPGSFLRARATLRAAGALE